MATDLSQVPTEQLQQWAGQLNSATETPVPSTTKSLSPDLSKVSTEQLQAWKDQLGANKNIGTNRPSLDPLLAIGGGISQGINDVAYGVQSLVNVGAQGLEKLGALPEGTSAKLNKAKEELYREMNPANEATVSAMQKHPELARAAKTGVDIAAMTAGGGIGANIGGAGIKAVTGDIVANTGVGLAASGGKPEGAVAGALGSVVGQAAGVTLGYVSNRINRLLNVTEREANIAAKSGAPPEEAFRALKSEIKTGGSEYSKDIIRSGPQEAILNTIQKSNPDVSPIGLPTQNILDTASKNFNKVKTINDTNYIELTKATGTMAPESTIATIKDVQADLPSLGLPKKSLPETSTLKDLMDYRKQISSIQSAANKQVINGIITHDEAQLYSTIKNSIDKDITKLAESQGLAGKLEEANNYWQENLKPFKIFTSSGAPIDPAKVTKSFNVIKKQLMSRNPNIEVMGNLAKTLGPEGKEKIGGAVIQNIYRRSFNNEGEFVPGRFNIKMQEYLSSGNASKIMTEEQIKALKGILPMSQAAQKVITKQGGSSFQEGAPGIVSKYVISPLLTTRPGIELLKSVSDKRLPAAEIENIAEELIKNVGRFTAIQSNSSE